MDIRQWTRRWKCPRAVMVLVATGCLTACGSSTSTETLTNDGKACLRNASAAIEGGLEAGPTEARIFFDTCLSSSCDTVQSKSCSASLDGSTLTVTSEIVIQSDTAGGCTADCGFATVTCDGPDLTDGSYTLKHGTNSAEFSVPSDDEVCGPGESPSRP